MCFYSDVFVPLWHRFTILINMHASSMKSSRPHRHFCHSNSLMSLSWPLRIMVGEDNTHFLDRSPPSPALWGSGHGFEFWLISFTKSTGDHLKRPNECVCEQTCQHKHQDLGWVCVGAFGDVSMCDEIRSWPEMRSTVTRLHLDALLFFCVCRLVGSSYVGLMHFIQNWWIYHIGLQKAAICHFETAL